MHSVIVAGGGIAGLAAAIALRMATGAHASAQAEVTVLERAAQFSELGAGIQLGPNAVHALTCLGVKAATVQQYASVPNSLGIYAIASGRQLAQMQLGRAVLARYGQPYLTIRRCDLHRLLLLRAQALGVQCRNGWTVQSLQQNTEGLRLHCRSGTTIDQDKSNGATDNMTPLITPSEHILHPNALVAADGVHGRLRHALLPNGGQALRNTGHWAYRATVPMDRVHSRWHHDVAVWWGKNMHVVHYPVAAGKRLNVVLLLENAKVIPKGLSSVRLSQPNNSAESGGDDTIHWAHTVSAQVMLDVLHQHTTVDTQLAQLLALPTTWGVWELADRLPDTTCAVGNCLLVGDAAHPMLPYLAQGAAMALEDAAQLLACLRVGKADAHTTAYQQAFTQTAKLRVQRNGRVQTAARRNARIFHLSGLPAWMRNAYLSVQSERLRMPWLYGWKPVNPL